MIRHHVLKYTGLKAIHGVRKWKRKCEFTDSWNATYCTRPNPGLFSMKRHLWFHNNEDAR